MTAIEIEKINEETLRMMDLYQKYDKEIFMVKNNDEFKWYDREEIELWEANIEELCIWTEKKYYLLF